MSAFIGGVLFGVLICVSLVFAARKAAEKENDTVRKLLIRKAEAIEDINVCLNSIRRTIEMKGGAK